MEDDKLIADFMNEYLKDHKGQLWYKNRLSTDQYEFNTSWDWLMPVVEKIEAIGYIVTIVKDRCQIILRGDINPKVSWCTITKIEAVYKAVIEFIKYYNQNI